MALRKKRARSAGALRMERHVSNMVILRILAEDAMRRGEDVDGSATFGRAYQIAGELLSLSSTVGSPGAGVGSKAKQALVRFRAEIAAAEPLQARLVRTPVTPRP